MYHVSDSNTQRSYLLHLTRSKLPGLNSLRHTLGGLTSQGMMTCMVATRPIIPPKLPNSLQTTESDTRYSFADCQLKVGSSKLLRCTEVQSFGGSLIAHFDDHPEEENFTCYSPQGLYWHEWSLDTSPHVNTWSASNRHISLSDQNRRHCTVAYLAQTHRAPFQVTFALVVVKMMRQAVLVILVGTLALSFPAELNAQSSPAPASAAFSVASANTTGSLGYLCSSQAGILSFLQGATANLTGASLTDLNISIPADLANSAATAQIAQVIADLLQCFMSAFRWPPCDTMKHRHRLACMRARADVGQVRDLAILLTLLSYRAFAPVHLTAFLRHILNTESRLVQWGLSLHPACRLLGNTCIPTHSLCWPSRWQV